MQLYLTELNIYNAGRVYSFECGSNMIPVLSIVHAVYEAVCFQPETIQF